MFRFLSRIVDSHKDESLLEQFADIPAAMLQLAIAGGNCDQTRQDRDPLLSGETFVASVQVA